MERRLTNIESNGRKKKNLDQIPIEFELVGCNAISEQRLDRKFLKSHFNVQLLRKLFCFVIPTHHRVLVRLVVITGTDVLGCVAATHRDDVLEKTQISKVRPFSGVARLVFDLLLRLVQFEAILITKLIIHNKTIREKVFASYLESFVN